MKKNWWRRGGWGGCNFPEAIFRAVLFVGENLPGSNFPGDIFRRHFSGDNFSRGHFSHSFLWWISYYMVFTCKIGKNFTCSSYFPVFTLMNARVISSKYEQRGSYFSYSEAVLHRCSNKKKSWKYAANLQENTHAKVLIQFWSGF